MLGMQNCGKFVPRDNLVNEQGAPPATVNHTKFVVLVYMYF